MNRLVGNASKKPAVPKQNGPLQVQTGRCGEIARALPDLPVMDTQ
jgi:hypothetical protein